MVKKSLQGKKAFIAGVGDDKGFGWAIAKELAEQGVEILLGTWAPIYKIFLQSWNAGKFDSSRKSEDGSLWNFAKVYPMDAMFDQKEDIPQHILENKRYKELSHYSMQELKEQVEKDFGQVDFLVHSLANAPEVKKPLLETSREGYLAALSSSAYSLISLVKHFGPIMSKQGSVITLSYRASEKVIPKYGGGMSSAKAALESDVRTLAFEAGRKWKIRINCISAGPLASRAAKAIGMIDDMITYCEKNAPLQEELQKEEVAQSAVFLLSSQASGITGTTLYVDKGMHAMGVSTESSQ